MATMSSPSRYCKALVDCTCREKPGEMPSSLIGEIPDNTSNQLRRPRTVPDLQSFAWITTANSPVPDKLPPRQPSKSLLNVTIQGSLGPVHLVMTHKNTVGDLITATIRQYVKEGRRPILATADPADFDLHYSQFSLESLDRMEKLVNLGSRNFFMCRNKSRADGYTTSLASTCCQQADQAAITKPSSPWLTYML